MSTGKQAQGGGGVRIPSAAEWVEQNKLEAAVSIDWRCGWDACRVEFPRTAPPSAPVGTNTYASTQATKCAECGEHKHTPLRIDAMGGYVCLTCIDQKLGSLLGEFGYPPSAPVGVRGMPAKWRAEADEIAANNWAVNANSIRARADELEHALAQQPAAVDEARPLGDWHEDDGPVVWWKLPVDEPAWIGTPLDSDWPGYHTHWTPHPAAPALAAQPGGDKA